jgi:hypothetical protein
VITEVFAGIPVDDFEAASAWYRIFVNRKPDMVPKEGEVAWRIAGNGWIYVVADDARAGSTIVTLLVDDLAAHVGSLAARGIAPVSVDTAPGLFRSATFEDPAGNTITVAQPL